MTTGIKNSSSADAIIIGGGAVGCGVAHTLAREGLKVVLFEERELAAGASGAMAGMLAPIAEAHEIGPFLRFGLESLRLYPTLCAELLERSGVDPEYVPCGVLRLARDEDEAAALREAEEEVGLPPDRVDLVGQLDIYITRTGYEVTPVVGIVNPPFPVKPDPFEVADVFEVPLSFIIDPANHERGERMYKGMPRQFYVLPYEDRFIWGATAGMLVNLSEVLRIE